MIPSEVAEIATLIWPDWSDLDEEDCREVIAAAWRVYNAGYRIAESTISEMIAAHYAERDKKEEYLTKWRERNRILGLALDNGAQEYGPLTWNISFTREAWDKFVDAVLLPNGERGNG